MNLQTAARLQELRKINGYSQEALAEKLGVSRQSISKWERAEASPEIDKLMALAEIYGTTVDDLLNTKNDRLIIQSTGTDDAPDIADEPEDFTANDKQAGKRSFGDKAKDAFDKADKYGMYPELAKKLFMFPYPLIVVLLYLALSFVTHMWHPLWLLFMTIPMYYRFASACKAKNWKFFFLLLPIPEIIVTLFLISGFFTGTWGLSSVLFIIIPIYYWIALMMKGKKNED